MHSREEEARDETEANLQEIENRAKNIHRKDTYHYRTVETLKEIESKLEVELQRVQAENLGRHGALRAIKNVQNGLLVRQTPVSCLEAGQLKQENGQSLLESKLCVPLDQVQAFYSGEVVKMSKSKLYNHILANKKIWASVEVGETSNVISLQTHYNFINLTKSRWREMKSFCLTGVGCLSLTSRMPSRSLSSLEGFGKEHVSQSFVLAALDFWSSGRGLGVQLCADGVELAGNWKDETLEGGCVISYQKSTFAGQLRSNVCHGILSLDGSQDFESFCRFEMHCWH